MTESSGSPTNVVGEARVETANGISIAYERLGERCAPAVLLINGLAAQLINWPQEFCDELLGAGFQVIRFDNRDCGRSTHMTSAPAPDLAAALKGDLSSVSYDLSDMAGDAAALLDALGIARAHIVGASMGGQIAQTLAIEYPNRVCSLVSMMSTTGAATVGQISPDVLGDVFAGGPAASREQAIEQKVRVMRLVGSPSYPSDLKLISARAGFAYDRGHDPLAAARQGLATIASGDRTERLGRLDVPTLVIHGLADRMCGPSGGQATAAAIPGAKLDLIEGMGHDFAPGLHPSLGARIADFLLRVQRANP